MDVRGKTVLVSGSNRGLGKAFVNALLLAGASKVYAGARDVRGLDIKGAQLLELDITDPVSVASAAIICSDVDLLINNAGYLRYGPLLSYGSVESVRRHFEVNTVGTLLMSRAFAPVLARRGGGAIINILSGLSWLNIEDSGPYSASKSAQWSLTNGLRNELVQQQTHVMAVHPGSIDTDMAAGVEASKTSPEEVVLMTLKALRKEQKELLIDNAGRWVKSTLSSPDACYL
jgi:NAD(P)-dependent dehydrogenase (short-subunit alcohol dehydrogenase family)